MPVLLRVPTPEAAERVWESFRYYITVAPTSRKPFALSGEEAQRVIETLKALLHRRG